jgi:hypothetical protein
MSLTGRSTCVSASALSLDAQPAHVESVVRRISRPVFGMGMFGILNDSHLNGDYHFLLDWIKGLPAQVLVYLS